MKDEQKTKSQLITELQVLRQQLACNEQLPTDPKFQQRLAYERGAAKCINILAEIDDFENRLSRVLAVLQKLVDASRVYIFTNEEDPSLGLCMTQVHELCTDGIDTQIDNPELQHLPYTVAPASLLPTLLARKPWAPIISMLPASEREILESQQILSILIVPVFTGDDFWGFIGFDDCVTERQWQDDDIRTLQSIADATSTAILRAQAENTLIVERAQLLSIFDSIDEIVYITDPETHEILYVNQAMQSAFQKELIGGICYKEFQGLDKPCEFCTNTIILKQKPLPHHWKYHNPTINRDFAIVDRIITWPDGRDVRFEFAQDITEQEQAKQTLQETHKLLLHSEKLSAIGRLSASIAHEFNNPLNGIQSVLEGVQSRSNLEQEDIKMVAMALDECDRVRRLIRNLLNFNAPSPDTRQTFNLHAVLDAILSMCAKELSNCTVLVYKEYGDDLPDIQAVPDQIKQVLLNLITNAKDVMQEDGGILTIMTEQKDRQVIVHISDTGPGIEPEHRDRIFEPFFTTKPAVKGTGLGLSVSYGIVRAHGGDIKVTSIPGKGSTFSLFLPIQGEP